MLNRDEWISCQDNGPVVSEGELGYELWTVQVRVRTDGTESGHPAT